VLGCTLFFNSCELSQNLPLYAVQYSGVVLTRLRFFLLNDGYISAVCRIRIWSDPELLAGSGFAIRIPDPNQDLERITK